MPEFERLAALAVNQILTFPAFREHFGYDATAAYMAAAGGRVL